MANLAKMFLWLAIQKQKTRMGKHSSLFSVQIRFRRANSLAYHAKLHITTVKSFIVKATGACIIKLFEGKVYVISINFLLAWTNVLAFYVMEWNSMLKKCEKKCLQTNIYSYLETSGGQISNLYLNVVHFFYTIVN